MRPTESEIYAACNTHGAQKVYDAAYRRMSGDHAALPKVGLADVKTIGDADFVGKTAFKLLDPNEIAADLADITIDQARY